MASFSSSNRMTHQNLAVCFGPVLLTPSEEAWRGGGRGVRAGGKGFGRSEYTTSAVDFKRHIEALHYMLQLWPGGGWCSCCCYANNLTFHRCPSASYLCYLSQCQVIVSQQKTTSTSPLLPRPPISTAPGAFSRSGVLHCEWLCPRTPRRRW